MAEISIGEFLKRVPRDLLERQLYGGAGIEHSIRKVIFHKPATIVFWADGTKTVVKCRADDIYDEEKGLALAIVKKIFGNTGRYHKVFEEWLPKEKEDAAAKLIAEVIKVPDGKKTYTINEYAKKTGKSPSTISRYCMIGKLKHGIDTNGRYVIFEE